MKLKKITAVGTGMLLLGSTLIGGLAYNLQEYPNKFVNQGSFDGLIVVGERASTADTIGAIDIAASLQRKATVQADIPAVPEQAVEEDKAFQIGSGSNALELREPVGSVASTITEDDLVRLRSGTIRTRQGRTDYKQYIRLKDGANLQDWTVNVVQNREDETSDFLVIDQDKPFVEWSIDFTSGLESERKGDGRLEDLENKNLNILGQHYSIIKATVDANGQSFVMTLLGGSFYDSLREGETRVYEVEGIDYEITPIFVSTPKTGQEPQVKISVNGEITPALREGEMTTLSGNTRIGVQDIVYNNRDAIVSFSFGAKKLELRDSTTNNGNDFTGKIEVDGKSIADGELSVLGSMSGNKFTLQSMKYRLKMDAANGNNAYVPAGHGVREFMKKPAGLLSDVFDIRYEGLTEVDTKDFKISAKGNSAYQVTFTNIRDQTFTFPLVTNKNGVWKYGSEKEDFIFVEGANQTDYNIGSKDYFVVTNSRGSGDNDKSVSTVLRYTGYDNSNRQIEFENVATGDTLRAIVTSEGVGNLLVNGHTYRVSVNDITSKTPTIVVDMNADGDWANDVVKLTTWGGAVVDFANSVDLGGTTADSTDGSSLAPHVGDGKNLASGQEIDMTATVLAKNFDSSNGGGETITWTIERGTGDNIDLEITENGYTGPRAGQVSGKAGEFQIEAKSKLLDRTKIGMTDWGILIKNVEPRGSPGSLTLEIPREQRTAQVFVTLGETTVASPEELISTPGAPVNPIAIKMAILDRNAPPVGYENMIIVGGPCVNTIADSLLKHPAVCTDGFEPGKAHIQTWEINDKVAVLVAGYEAVDTQGATRALAEYEKHNFKGETVEVTAKSLNNIKVTPINTKRWK